jgi:hypothetical protein
MIKDLYFIYLFIVYSAIWLNLLPRDDCRFFYIFLWMIVTLATNKNSLNKIIVDMTTHLSISLVQYGHQLYKDNIRMYNTTIIQSTYVRGVIFVQGLGNGYISL